MDLAVLVHPCLRISFGRRARAALPPPKRKEGTVAQETVLAPRPGDESFVARLAQFFPDATAVRIPVHVSGVGAQGQDLSEHTIIEYGTPNEVLFASTLPLEFDDRVRLENSDGSLKAEAAVVAVQYHNGKVAVAVRFLREIANWIIKR